MLKRTHTVEPHGLTTSHTRIETAEREPTGREYNIHRLDARRVTNTFDGDHAQIEINLIEKGFFKQRERSMSVSMILSPEQCRALAFAVCPELKSTLEAVTGKGWNGNNYPAFVEKLQTLAAAALGVE